MKQSGLGVTALVFGILAIAAEVAVVIPFFSFGESAIGWAMVTSFTGVFWLPPLALIVILGIVFAAVSIGTRKRHGNSITAAVAGLALAIVASIPLIWVGIATLIVWGGIGTDISYLTTGR